MNEKIKSKDKRNPGFFIIDNEILDDYELTDTAFWIYCELVKFSMNKSKEPFISIKKSAKKINRGKESIMKALDLLIEKELIEYDDKTKIGCKIFNILPVKKRVSSSGQVNNEGCPEQDRGCPDQDTNKNNNKILRKEINDSEKELNHDLFEQEINNKDNLNNIDSISKIDKNTEEYISESDKKRKNCQKSEKLKSEAEIQKDEILEIWFQNTGRDLRNDKKYSGYIFGKLKKIPFIDLKNAITAYSLDNWHNENEAWILGKLFRDQDELEKWIKIGRGLNGTSTKLPQAEPGKAMTWDSKKKDYVPFYR